MLRIFDSFMRQFIIREVIVFMKLFKIVFGMLMFAHFSACLWWFVGSRTSPSWIDSKGLRNSDLPVFEKYSYAWYWAVVTLFTTGYGDIVATNAIEQWVCSICILIGTCFFAYFVGTLTVLITEGDKIKSYELEKLEEAQSFCEKKKLPKELTRAILTHIRYHCTYNYVFDESEILNILPSYLQHDIHTYVSKQLLLQLKIFKNEYIELPDFIIGLIAVKTKSISCNQNYKLYDTGDMAKEFYIQRTGRSELLDKHNNKLYELSRGDVCGEYSALLFKRRKLRVKCNTWSEFYSVNIDDIKEIFDTYYPKSSHSKWKKIKKYVKSAYKKNIKHQIEWNNYNLDPYLLSDSANNNNGFNAPSLHSVFSFNKNNTNIDKEVQRHTHSAQNSHQEENSVHLFNNTRNNHNDAFKLPQTPGPVTPITPNNNHMTINSNEIVIVTNENEESNSKSVSLPVPVPMPKNVQSAVVSLKYKNKQNVKFNSDSKSKNKNKNRNSLKKRAMSSASVAQTPYATPISVSRVSTQTPRDFSRVNTPKRNTFAAKFHMRSNSELRDLIIVTHAEKHNKLTTLKSHAKITPNNSDDFKKSKSSIERTATLKHYKSEPVIITQGITTAYTNTMNSTIDEFGKMHQSSIQSQFSSYSVNDSECSFSSVETETESSFDDNNYQNNNNQFTRTITQQSTNRNTNKLKHIHNNNNNEFLEKRHHSKQRDSHLHTSKKKRIKKSSVKKGKGKGKFGAGGRRGGGATKHRKAVNRNQSNVDRDKRHRKKKHNNILLVNDSTKHSTSDYSDYNSESEIKTPKPTPQNKRMSIDPNVLLAPLNQKKITKINANNNNDNNNNNEYTGYVQSMSMNQNIQNINININGINGNENKFVMSPDYEIEEDITDENHTSSDENNNNNNYTDSDKDINDRDVKLTVKPRLKMENNDIGFSNDVVKKTITMSSDNTDVHLDETRL